MLTVPSQKNTFNCNRGGCIIPVSDNYIDAFGWRNIIYPEVERITVNVCEPGHVSSSKVTDKMLTVGAYCANRLKKVYLGIS